MTTDYYATLEPNRHYHLFNRGNNRENLFPKAENYRYFLEKYTQYLSVLLDTYAYALLPNHFHLLVRVRTPEEMAASVRQREAARKQSGEAWFSDFPTLHDLESLSTHEVVSEAFRRFFMAYAKAINKQEGRVGSLFQKNFRRLALRSEGHFTTAICYLHANPQLHGICTDFKDWPHTSYYSFLSDSSTRLQRAWVMERFGGKDRFVQAHVDYLRGKRDEHFRIEED